MDGGQVCFLDEVVGDEVSSNLVAGVVLLLVWHGISVEAFHSYFKQVFVVLGFCVRCRLLDPTLAILVRKLRPFGAVLIHIASVLTISLCMFCLELALSTVVN